MPETTPLIKAALNLRVGAGFDVYFLYILPLIYKNIAIDVVEKERKRRGGKHYQASMMHMIFGGNPGSSKRRRIIH